LSEPTPVPQHSDSGIIDALFRCGNLFPPQFPGKSKKKFSSKRLFQKTMVQRTWEKSLVTSFPS
jgi:hypothetical protein